MVKLRLKENRSAGIKTQGYSNQKYTYINQIIKNITPSKLNTHNQYNHGNYSSHSNHNHNSHNTYNTYNNTNDKWKFISIQLKEDYSKTKNKKLDLKISSHRSYIIPNYHNTRIKVKSSTSMTKNIDKVPKLKGLNKLNKSKF